MPEETKAGPQPSQPGQLPAEHTVVHGDELSLLAQQYYGNGDEVHWRKIYDANKETIGADPNVLKPGEKLTIPA